MALADKYQSVVDAANQNGVTDLNVQEQGDVLYITGVVPTDAAKQAIWDARTAMDPDMRESDLVLTIAVSGEGMYEVKRGDNMTHIARDHGVSLQALEDANRDVVKNPDRIFPGQKLVIPKAG
ncbi:MAG TPA: LysM peptidoglycan-binding domain-containing protein [Pyrinomonadaceae bacterium]|jgi:LysM repeat protein|nr:LysM peptidoglycan-binding domain-containing protein [Pyrinomonadaceae bacterium]